MNELSNFLVESILEDENPIKKTVVIYVGRFQPMHKGHAGTYEHLVKKFGKDNVYVGTSDKVELPKSPFNFNEKVKIMTTMFKIPKSKIHKVKNPYKPTEILKKFDEETTAFITVVGMKDKNRLGGKYFQPWNGEATEGYRDRGYVYAAPSSGGGISGTETRNGLSVGSEEQKKDFFKKRAYGKFNATIFKMITDKLNEDLEVKKEWIYDSLNEISLMGTDGTDVDDGPNIVYPSAQLFNKMSIERAAQIGFEIVGHILGGQESIDKTDYRLYKNGDGPVGAVSFFPAGIIGNQTPNNQVDIFSKGAYSQWYQHATRTASLVGYEVVRGLGVHKDDATKSGDDAKGAKELEKEFETSLKENIVLPVKVGDTILTGRFKNKKVKVKTIGKDEHGMPTINGKKVVTFRLIGESFVTELAGTEVKCEKCNHQWKIESDDDEKYLCHSCGYDSQKQEYDFDAFDSWREKMGLSEINERGKMRPADKLRRKAAMAGKRAQIARRRARTMNRRKSYDKLKKIAYKMAYRQVYNEFHKELFPDTPKSDLSIQQSKVIHKNVVRKKGRVLKRAKFKFLPALRAKEAEKFGKKNEMSKSTLNKIEKFAEKKLSPEDIEFTKHFFDRVNDPRNGKEISDAELTGFFKRLSKYKKKFKEFLEKYQQIVVTDKRHDINIPFVKQANQIIAKTVMRKKNFQTSNPKLAFEGMIMEGGAYGHMNHPFDTEINLTFGQLKDIVNRALDGKLDYTREKTDGQALAISWRDGRLVAARNKGHLKNKGENALDIKGVSDKFQNRGGLTDAYNFAMKDLSNAISALSDKQRDKIFKQGACFMNLEVIYPTSVNVIPYGQALLVFHGTMEYNDEGVAIGENGEAARILAGMIKQVNKDVQDNYTIQGPPVVELPKRQDLSKRKSVYNSKISRLQKEFKLKDTDGVAVYHQSWWERWVEKNSPTSLDNKTKMGLVKRWAFMDKSFRLDNKNITDPKTLEWAKKHEKDNHKKIAKDNLMKFENIFLGLGAEVLQFTSSALTVNPDKAVRDIKKRIDKTIKDVKKSGDPKKIEKLRLELGRLNSIGGAGKIVPNEGIVFTYNGNTFKLTGTFASVNQILGIFF